MTTNPNFTAWMQRNHQGVFHSAYPCWNWRIGGVLVTQWLGSGLVKIYRDQGRHTECHPSETERAREAVMSLGGRLTPQPPTP